MQFGGLVWVVLVFLITIAGARQAQGASFEREFGATKPPVGFVKFCARNPDDCRNKVRPALFAQKLNMTPDLWNLAKQINAFVNLSIQPVSDMDQYGVAEYWTIPDRAGDCEDFVLLKKRNLEGLGFPSSALLITVVLDEKKEGHAVLTLATKQGDYILDNRLDEILAWNDVRYAFLKRQSASDPLRWVSLNRQQNAVPPLVSTRSDGLK